LGTDLEYQREWRRNNPDRVLAYRLKHKENQRVAGRRWKKNNPEKDKESKRKSAKRYAIKYPDKMKQSKKKYYQKNKERYRIWTNNRRRKLRNEIVTKFGTQCYLCGYNKCPEALEFHHKNKIHKKQLTENYSKSYIKGVYVLKNQIDQFPERFILLCANCHREVEAGITKI